MKYLLSFLILASFGCAKNNIHLPPSKELFSLWMASDNSGLDFSIGKFSTPFQMIFILANSQKCSCNTTITGSQSQGTYSFGSCTFIASSGGSDPGCNLFQASGPYTNSSTLNFCITSSPPTFCQDYH